MELVAYDTSWNVLSIVDVFESAIWTERFDSAGDFELTVPMGIGAERYLVEGNYLGERDSLETGIIEKAGIVTSDEDGDYWRVMGRHLPILLDRRIVYPQQVLTGGLQTAVQTLLNANAITAPDTNRRIPGLVFYSSTDTEITSPKVNVQYTGDSVYESIRDICIDNAIGFTIQRTNTGVLSFFLRAGVDRSYDQSVRPYVAMSAALDNLGDTTYLVDASNYRTTAYVAGEGEGSARRWIAPSKPLLSGINRRETYVDARDLQKKMSNDVVITQAAYDELLKQRGMVRLNDNRKKVEFTGKVLDTGLFVYGRDYFLGDIVQLENEYGMTAKAKIKEYIRSSDKSGDTAYPSFVVM